MLTVIIIIEWKLKVNLNPQNGLLQKIQINTKKLIIYSCFVRKGIIVVKR